ncbi:MAG: hypothetical protein GX608_02560, partial [Lentisphaerae bacterium]|nr:hypothetical protein [Lentisphaerota bacterium]
MPFSLHEDFSIRDERGRSCQIEIEENSALSNGHARITDEGKYHLTLNGNKHFLNTPALRNFRLKLDAALVIHSMEFGCGFLLYFRHDRRTGAGQVLKAYWDTDFTFTLSVNGRCLHTRKNAERPDFSSLKPALTVAENRLEFEWEGRTYAADIPDAPGLPERGAVGFDVAFSPGGTMLVSSVNLESDDALPKKRIGQPLDFTLACVQGFSEPLRYTVDLFRYETGEVELACTMGGTIRGRGPRKNAGGRQWTYESDRLTQPYLRIESDGEEWANLLLANGTLLLMDPEEDRLCVKLFPNIPWPARRRFVFRGFPEHFLIAAGYERAAHGPWRFAANGPYELIKTPDNRVVYEGGALRRDAVALTAASPADKRLTTRIPRETPGYDRALKHAAGQHYYFESERVSFTVTCTYRASRYERDELKVRAAFTDPYGGPLAAGAFTVDERGRRRLEGGFESRDVSITLAKNPGCGVYHLDLGVEAGPATVCESRTVFEVLSDDPAGPCP